MLTPRSLAGATSATARSWASRRRSSRASTCDTRSRCPVSCASPFPPRSSLLVLDPSSRPRPALVIWIFPRACTSLRNSRLTRTSSRSRSITYIVLSVPGTLLAKQFLPSTTIACGALIWSCAATCQAAVTNPAGLYVCRLFVGVGEAMFGQAMALYFTMWCASALSRTCTSSC